MDTVDRLGRVAFGAALAVLFAVALPEMLWNRWRWGSI
jgi:hypothetical protein